MRAVSFAAAHLALAGVAGCGSPLVEYARLVGEDLDFGEFPVDTSATEAARIENLTSDEAHVYFLPPTPFSASVEEESGEEYVPVDLDEHIPIAPGGTAEVALTYWCEVGEEGPFDSHVVVVAGASADGPWTATQEVGALRFRGTCVAP